MRPAFARINLNALRHNYRLAKKKHGARVLAVIKSNAYGHGAVACARALAEADGFAVAFVEEALPLREAGITRPIVILEGAFDAEDYRLASIHRLTPVIHHQEQLRLLVVAALPSPLPEVWLKLNTGMNRVGFAPQRITEVLAQLHDTFHVRKIVCMTHFACADLPEKQAVTIMQIDGFDQAAGHLGLEQSLANSAGILCWPHSRRDWGRAGIMLYGAHPSGVAAEQGSGLLPVMTLGSAVMAIRELAPGQTVGYGSRFCATRPTRLALVAMGYADGYPRILPDNTPVWVDGQIVPLAGRVSMDMLTVDITDAPHVRPGSPVELWGEHIPVSRIAEIAGTIAYELLCHVQRVRFDYFDGELADLR